MEWDIVDIENEGTSVKKDSKKGLTPTVEKVEDSPAEEDKEDYKDKNYRTWAEIPKEERKHYGI